MIRWPRLHLGFTAFIVAGIALAVLVLVQTVWTYVFVSRDLERREARRQAGRDVAALERSIVAGRSREPAALAAALSDLRRDAAARLAWVLVVGVEGQTLAGAPAGQATRFTGAELDAAAFAREEPSRDTLHDDREVLVYLFPLRLPAGPPVGGAATPPPPGATGSRTGGPPRRRGPTLVEVGVYRDGISAQYGGLRRASIVNALAAFVLMTSLVAMALRFPAYVRGRQIDAQLLLARRVQQDLLPVSMPALQHTEVEAVCAPAFDVGGDFFDFVELDERRFVFILGDVSGKGVDAALLMAVVHGAFHGGELASSGGDLSRWTSRLNDMLVQRSAENRFVTLFCGAYDARTATLAFVNAGHVPPLLFRAGASASRDPERLETGGTVVGLRPDATYQVGQAVVHDGDVLVIYSDGVTEASNGREGEFGLRRLSTTVASTLGGDVRLTCSGIITAVRAFASRAEPEDDLTVMVLRFGERRDRPSAVPNALPTTPEQPVQVPAVS